MPGKTPDWNRVSEEFEMKWRKLLKEISMSRGIEMAKKCISVDDEGFYSRSSEKKPGYFRLVDELKGSEMYKKKRISRKGLAIDRWLVKAIHWYCSGCAVYQPCARACNWWLILMDFRGFRCVFEFYLFLI